MEILTLSQKFDSVAFVTSLSRKHREFQAREELILDHAQDLLHVKGYMGLNLDELAKQIEYSKGTIYLHFASKEDLLLGVVIRAVDVRNLLFRHAARYPGRSREKCCAIGVADLMLNVRQPRAFQMMQLVSTDSIWEKTSPERRQKLRRATKQTFELALGVVQQAFVTGDLSDYQSIPPEEIVMGLFTMSKGAMLVKANEDLFSSSISCAVMESLQKNRHRFLDGVGWKPLYKEFDYESLENRLNSEYFAVPYEEM